MSKKVAVLGSTGSIGRNALDVISKLPQHLRVWGLSANTNWRLLAEQAAAFKPEYLSISDAASAAKLSEFLPEMASRLLPPAEFVQMAAEEADIALVAVVGAAGLEPSLALASAGKRLALANKESLVMAGGLVMEKARQSGAEVIPVDSEHSAVFQAIRAGRPSEVRRVIITASGGPFLNRPTGDFDAITVEEALSHPTWSMGPKITIDSATMVNKAFEVIEAHWLFGLPADKISVLIHPESIVHSLVEFADSSFLAQLSLPDMRLPIQYALTYPERLSSSVTPLDLTRTSGLTFREPDPRRFPCLEIGFEVAREGGTLGAVFNAANEIAVRAFLDGRLAFSGIHRVIRTVVDKHSNARAVSLEAVLDADRWARKEAELCL
jgi:1-deoxy-D-xylulose-5-phosphate reductoisomerase